MFESLDKVQVACGKGSLPEHGRELLLLELPSGAWGIVIDVANGAHQSRMMELGFVPGARVSVVQDGGGSVLLALGGSRLALSREYLPLIRVRPEHTQILDRVVKETSCSWGP